MRRRYSYQLDPLRVWLLLRLRRRCGWRRVCRGRSRSRARQQIPNENQGKDNCRCDDEQPVCVHRVCPRFSLPHHVSPRWGSGTSQTIRAETHSQSVPARGASQTPHTIVTEKRSLRKPRSGFVRRPRSPLLRRTSSQLTPTKEGNRIPSAKGGSAQHQFQLRSCDEPGRRDEPSRGYGIARSPIGASSSTSWAQAEEVATQIAANVAAAIKRGMEEFPGGISEDELDLTRAEQPLAGAQ